MFSILLLSLPCAALQTPAPTPEPASASKSLSPEEQFAELQKRNEASELGYAERAAAFRDEYLKFAAENAGSEVGLKAEIVLLRSCWWLEKEDRYPAAKKQVDAIMKVYSKSPSLMGVVEVMNYLYPKVRTRCSLPGNCQTQPSRFSQGNRAAVPGTFRQGQATSGTVHGARCQVRQAEAQEFDILAIGRCSSQSAQAGSPGRWSSRTGNSRSRNRWQGDEVIRLPRQGSGA